MKVSGFIGVVLVGVLAIGFASDALAGPGPGGPPPDQPVCTSGLLTVEEEADILFMREEEKLARDVYLAMYDLWQADVFLTIAESEQRHMDAMLRLIDCYELIDPVVDDTPGVFTDPLFAQMYTDLVQAGTVSLLGAFEAGMLIEETDIADLRAALALTGMENITRVYTNLESASCSHLRAFNRQLLAAGVIYVPQVLTPEEFAAIVDPSSLPFQMRWKGGKEPVMERSRVGPREF